jgi:hypothetical protein
MNIVLLCIVWPLTILLVLDTTRFLHSVYTLEKEDYDIVLGVLCYQNKWFVVWYLLTFLVSSVGLLWIFFLHLINSPDIATVFFFASFHLSLIASYNGILKRNVRCVFISMCTTATCYTGLAVYTLHRFPMCDGCTLRTLTRASCYVLVIHTLINNLFIWQMGWWKRLPSAKIVIGAYLSHTAYPPVDIEDFPLPDSMEEVDLFNAKK